MDKDPKRTGDGPISDSEKGGAITFGQHCSGSLEIVPIKKRRFLFVHSPSPLQSSYSDDSDHLLDSHPASYQETSAYGKHHDQRSIANKSTCLNDVIDEASDAADLSGISILAAAACNSEMVGDTMNAGGLVSKGNSCKEVHSLYEDNERQLQSSEDIQENCNVPMETCSTFIPAEDEIKFDESPNKKSSMSSLQNVSDEIRPYSVSRLHWDLNTDMDAWNSNCNDVLISVPLATDLVGENDNPNEKLEDFETCQCQVENGQSSCPSELNESLVKVAGIPRYSRAFIANEELEKPDTCSGNSADLKVDDDNDVGSKAISNVMVVAKTDANLVDGAMDTQPAGKSYMDGCVNFHYNHDSDASQVDAGQATGLEKVDLSGDDDSQFEDGEYRESVLHSWGGDGVDDAQLEHVDYGSDNRENDIFETVPSSHACASFSTENMAYKKRNLMIADGVHAGKDRQVAIDQSPSKCSSKSDSLDSGQGKRAIGDVDRMDHANHLALNSSREQRNVIEELVSGASRYKVMGYVGFDNTGDNTREPSAGVRMKSSGWDRLPEGCRHTGHSLPGAGIGSVKQDDTAGSLDVFGADESLRRSGLSFRGGLSSRVKRPQSSDESRTKYRSYVRSSRSNDRNGLDAKAERNTLAPKSAGRGGSSRHTQGRGRDEYSFHSNNRHGPRHHDSPAYYDTHCYAQPASRNAAAAAVAKAQSNGFVVSPDGTLAKAGGAGTTAGHVPRRSANDSLQSTHPSLSRWGSRNERDYPCGMHRRHGDSREISPKRHLSVGRGQAGKYAHEMVRDWYGRSMPDDRLASSLALHHLSTRDRSFPSHRGPLRLSHSRIRSPSRSRTRSPHPWASHRGRSDIGMKDVPIFHRRSRSPIARIEKMRSPHPQPNFEEHIVYGSVSRTLASPLHASRLVDERKDSPYHFRVHEYNNVPDEAHL